MVTFSYQKHVGLWKSVDGTEAERAIAGDIDDSVNSKHIAQAVFCHSESNAVKECCMSRDDIQAGRIFCGMVFKTAAANHIHGKRLREDHSDLQARDVLCLQADHPAA